MITGDKIRMTSQRRAILAELSKVKSHPTAEDIFHMVRRRLSNISLATVYRNLEDLAHAGLILKLKTAGHYKRFDATIDEHYHARCTKCGKVEDLHSGPIAGIARLAKKVRGFKVEGHSLEYFGLCSRCQRS